ncbi:MAG: hypothetical protein CMM84_10610 [Rhodothermaceae bacterium]|nr:hypothetical protein [Rhodothermaceae bacterium]MBC14679.1 hypothetical protein [Rhodothermaceae bacterium]
MTPPNDTPADRPDPDDVDDTIDPTSEVDEALYETFPASDAPGYTEGSVGAEAYEADDEADDEDA